MQSAGTLHCIHVSIIDIRKLYFQTQKENKELMVRDSRTTKMIKSPEPRQQQFPEWTVLITPHIAAAESCCLSFNY